MNTAVSSRRVLASPGRETLNNGTMLLVLIAGFLLMVLGVATEIALLAGAGFVGFASALLYYNGKLWAAVYKKHGTGLSTRISRVVKFQ